MSLALQLVLALVLDAALGEPRWLWSRFPHPAILMGRVIGWCDRQFNRALWALMSGALTLIGVMVLAAVVGWAIAQMGGLVATIAAAILLAHRSLVAHVHAVADGLRQSDESGRRAVSMIVSRDVTDAKSDRVARASIESLAENFSDGVVAPAFWFIVAGLPGILVYKMVNTADSMIGYRTPRHEAFGKAAARTDDLLNWVPARLTAVLLALVGGGLHQWQRIRSDARLHRSPNAGWPEAALAHSLDFALAGPRSYHGEVQDFAWVNGAGLRDLGPKEIDAAIALVWKAWGCLLGIGVILCLLSGI